VKTEEIFRPQRKQVLFLDSWYMIGGAVEMLLHDSQLDFHNDLCFSLRSCETCSCGIINANSVTLGVSTNLMTYFLCPCTN
jgi:hypothetical protein